MFFRFELAPDAHAVDGLTMGHLTVVHGQNVVSSKEYGSKQLMMPFLSLIELLDGLRRLVTSRTKRYEFIGVDSSFSLLFEKTKKDLVRVSHVRKELATIPRSELTRSTYEACFEFWRIHKKNIPKDDMVADDVENSLKKFYELVEANDDC